MKPRSPNSTHTHMGKRIRMRRNELKISQADLGDALGISFQQIQKYEKGTNRIDSVRLQRIAAVLECDVGFFMQEAPSTAPGKTDSVMDSFMATKDGLIIAEAFVRIGDPFVRHTIASFVDQLSRDRGAAMMAQAAE